jgi:hypothetical protein
MVCSSRVALFGGPVFAVIALAGTPAQAAPFFESVWDAELGSSDDAVTDGMAWDAYETNAELIAVEAIDGPDVPPELQGQNMATVALEGEPNWAMVVERDVGTDTQDHFYWRMYLRVSSAPQTNWASVHPFQDFEDDGIEGGRSMNFYIGLSTRNADRTGWAPYFSSYAPQPETVASNFTINVEPGDPYLETDKWYRFEGHIEYLERQGQFVRTRYDINIFDPAGDPETPVYTTADFRAANCSDECYGTSLADHYDDGEGFYFRSGSTTFTIGNNGPSQATGSGSLYDVAAVALAHDDWIGPYGGAPPEGTTGDDTGGGSSGDDGTESGTSGGGDATGDGPGDTGDGPDTTSSASTGSETVGGETGTSGRGPSIDEGDGGGCRVGGRSPWSLGLWTLLLFVGRSRPHAIDSRG